MFLTGAVSHTASTQQTAVVSAAAKMTSTSTSASTSSSTSASTSSSAIVVTVALIARPVVVPRTVGIGMVAVTHTAARIVPRIVPTVTAVPAVTDP